MSLNWSWSEKCGEAVFEQNFNGTKEFTVSLYQGNAFLIFLYEFKDSETGEGMYNMYSFWADEGHAKRCLALTKNGDGVKYNIYSERDVLKKIRLNKSKCHELTKIVGLLVRAFDDLVIEIYSE